MTTGRGAELVYLYGLLSTEAAARPAAATGRPAPSLRGAPRGVPGASTPKLLPAGDDLWLVAASVPKADYSAARIDASLRDLDWVSRCALAHEAVVEFFSRSGTLIPVKLFTLFESPERAAADMRARRRELRAILTRVANREEWGVQLRAARDAPRRKPPARRPTSGTDFLQAKQAARREVIEAAQNGLDQADRLFRQLKGGADDSQRRAIPAGNAAERLLLDAVFLVPRKHAARFRTLASRNAKRCGGDGLTLTLTGPWPPYHFARGPA